MGACVTARLCACACVCVVYVYVFVCMCVVYVYVFVCVCVYGVRVICVCIYYLSSTKILRSGHPGLCEKLARATVPLTPYCRAYKVQCYPPLGQLYSVLGENVACAAVSPRLNMRVRHTSAVLPATQAAADRPRALCMVFSSMYYYL